MTVQEPRTTVLFVDATAVVLFVGTDTLVTDIYG
jgi:hypothetical protein